MTKTNGVAEIFGHLMTKIGEYWAALGTRLLSKGQARKDTARERAEALQEELADVRRVQQEHRASRSANRAERARRLGRRIK